MDNLCIFSVSVHVWGFFAGLGCFVCELDLDQMVQRASARKNIYHYICYQNNYISNRTKRKAKTIIFSKPLVLVSATCNVKATGNVVCLTF